MRAVEVLLLELSAYIALHVATDSADPNDNGLVEAHEEFKKLLEGTV